MSIKHPSDEIIKIGAFTFKLTIQVLPLARERVNRLCVRFFFDSFHLSSSPSYKKIALTTLSCR